MYIQTMKHIIFSIIISVISLLASAQAPTKFRYQAVARDVNNQPYANTPLRVKFSILEGAANGP
jgi:hypothetical protein